MSNLSEFHKKHRYYKTEAQKKGTIDKFKRYLLTKDKIELPERDIERFERIKTAQAMMLKHNPVMHQRDVMRALIKMYGKSERQTLRDIRDAQELFGDVDRVNKDFERIVYSNWLKDIVSLCFAKMDFKTAVEAIKQLVTLNEINVKEEELDSGVAKTYNLNIMVNTADGPKVMVHDMDKLDELDFTEFETIVNTIDKPRVGITEMSELLQEYNGGSQESDVE